MVQLCLRGKKRQSKTQPDQGDDPKTLTMTLGDGVVQRCLAVAVGRVEGAPVLQQQAHHGRGADGRGAVEGVLAAAVADAG